jgi:hypothetical protein
MAEDFYWQAAKARSDQLEAELAAATADLQAYRRNGDSESAASTVQQLADLQAQRNNLATLWNQHVSAQRGSQPYVSQEARHARGPSEMDTQDIADIMNGSKVGGGRPFTAEDYYRLRNGLPSYYATRGRESK